MLRRLLSSLSVLLPVVIVVINTSACTPPNQVPPNNNNNNNVTNPCAVGDTGVEVGFPEEPACIPDSIAAGTGKCDADEDGVADGEAVDLSCIGAPPALGAGTNVTVEGCIDIFGLGGAAVGGIHVSIFGDDQNPSTDVPAFGDVEIATQNDADGLDCVGVDANTPACLSLGCEKEGYYRIENIPTHVPLTMKVSKPNDGIVVTTYSFGIVFGFADAAVGEDGIARYAANLIYRSTIDSIPTLAGRLVEGQNDLSDGIGRGIIAGEIHDCADRIVQGASVTSDFMDPTTKVTYFDGDTEDPKPDLRRLSTNTDGLYVFLNTTTDAGKDVHTISAGMLDPACEGEDCQCVSLSSRTVRAFPDSVSIVTLRGDVPTE